MTNGGDKIHNTTTDAKQQSAVAQTDSKQEPKKEDKQQK